MSDQSESEDDRETVTVLVELEVSVPSNPNLTSKEALAKENARELIRGMSHVKSMEVVEDEE